MPNIQGFCYMYAGQRDQREDHPASIPNIQKNTNISSDAWARAARPRRRLELLTLEGQCFDLPPMVCYKTRVTAVQKSSSGLLFCALYGLKLGALRPAA